MIVAQVGRAASPAASVAAWMTQSAIRNKGKQLTIRGTRGEERRERLISLVYCQLAEQKCSTIATIGRDLSGHVAQRSRSPLAGPETLENAQKLTDRSISY